jgi:16S rRNA C967 or C1407 C5-methylase (RsmB/RsmF family)
MTANEKKGKAAFIDYYQSLFKDETPSLIQALGQTYPPVVWFPKIHEDKLKHLWQKHGLIWQPLSWYAQALVWPRNLPFHESLPGVSDGLAYLLSPSSLLPVIALEINPPDTVLDACAAPGGKSLVIADTLASPSQLIANDVSPERLKRMKRTFSSFKQNSIRVVNKPAQRLPLYYSNHFDKVLADVPCSSELHVWNDKDHLDKWQMSRIHKLQHIQINLVSALIKTVKPGGLLVYSTCALTPLENEVVVERVLETETSVRLVIPELPLENVSHGLPRYLNQNHVKYTFRILPHLHHQSPAFFAVFKKNSL